MNIGDKVYIIDWLQIYSDVYRWVDDKKESIWNWETEIPNYSSIDFHIKRKYIPKLTKKGKPYANGKTVLKSEIPAYKNYEYTILETRTRKDGKILFLVSSKEGCFVQIGEKGITKMTFAEQKLVAKLEKELHLQALSVKNLRKWDINSKKKDFPKELLKYLYDKNQNSQFGNTMTKATIKYPYISKEYTINGNDICLGWEQSFDGGCDLSNEDIISWNELAKRFPENKFK